MTRPLVLLVDDEPEILTALVDLLEDRYELHATSSPLEALRWIETQGDLAVIVSDQRMPQMTGDVFLAQARPLTDAEAILLTGYADLSAVTNALNAGGIVGYQPKPWEGEALRAMIAAAVERWRLRRDLEHHQALLNGLMQHVPAGVAFKDGEGRLIAVNPPKATALGVAEDEALGRTEGEITGEEGADETSETPTLRLIERRSAEGPVWIERTLVPLRGPGPRQLVVERDITAQKLAEHQLRQDEKLRALGTLAGGVAHDFNNLLTAILGSLELIGRRLPPGHGVQRYLDAASTASKKGASLTQKLLGFSRQSHTQTEVTDVVGALTDAQELICRTLGGAVTVNWDLPSDLWPAQLEQDQLELAVLNLCVNSRDAMGGAGAITIRARNLTLEPSANSDRPAGEVIALTVEDDGPGIPPEILERVLEPFFTTKAVGKGTGLGLSMVYGFAQRSGGAFDLENRAEGGLRATLYLPRAAESERRVVVDTTADCVSTPTRVLVVDDEAVVRGVTSGLLREMGHTVVEAASGAEALSRLEEGVRPDIALVDFAMPGLNGVELAHAFEQAGHAFPVVLVTGFADIEILPGHLTVVRKPFAPDDLQRSLVESLSRPR